MTSKPALEPLPAPPFNCLRVIDDPEGRSGSVNMALDEVLLQGAVGGSPLLRFYRWRAAAVSFGYFGPADEARRLARGREIVRRPTGGGLVEHGDDLTYTLVVPRPNPFVNLRSAETYRIVHAALAWALAQAGVQTRPHQEPGAPTFPADGNACFLRPVTHDLVVDGGKVAGGAQRRTRAGLLHQGSIRLVTAQSVVWTEAVRETLPSALARRCDRRGFSVDELDRAEALAAAKYATATWTNRR